MTEGMRRPRRAALALLALLSLAACGDAEGIGDSHTVTDSAGIRIVESVAPSSDAPPRIEAEPLVEVGREENGPYQLGFVGPGVLLAGGAFAIGEAMSREIRIFEADGTHRVSLGGPGEGPGEFGDIADLGAGPGDSIVVFDQRNRRFAIVPASGGGVRHVPLAVDGNYVPFGHLGDGTPILADLSGSRHPDLDAGLHWISTDVVAQDLADGSTRVLASLPNQLRRADGLGEASMPQPGHAAGRAVGPDGFYWGIPTTYEIVFRDAEGAVRRILRRPVEPTAVTDSMIAEFVEIQLDRVRTFAGEAAVPRYRRSFEEEAWLEHLPVLGAFLVDDEGRLWVGSVEWPSQGVVARWSLFSPDGVWIGDVESPEGLRILDIREGRVLGVWRDELDVPRVRVHRIVGS